MKEMNSKPLKIQSIRCLLDEFDLAAEHLPLAHALEDFDFEEHAQDYRQEAKRDRHKGSEGLRSSLLDIAEQYESLGEKVDDYLGDNYE